MNFEVSQFQIFNFWFVIVLFEFWNFEENTSICFWHFKMVCVLFVFGTLKFDLLNCWFLVFICFVLLNLWVFLFLFCCFFNIQFWNFKFRKCTILKFKNKKTTTTWNYLKYWNCNFEITNSGILNFEILTCWSIEGCCVFEMLIFVVLNFEIMNFEFL